MTKIFLIALPALLLATSLLGRAQAAPVGEDVVQVEVHMAQEAPRPETPAYAELERSEMSEHLDPLAIGGIAGAIGVYSIVSAIRRRRAEQEACPKPV